MAELTQKERTRARILDEAAKAIREHGSDGIGVAALMKRAGLTHGGFYAHFENRDDLVANAVERMFQDSSAMLGRYLGDGDAAAGLGALIDYYLSDDLRQRVDRGCPLPGLSGEVRRMPPAARQRFSNGITGFREALQKGLAAIGKSDPEALASSILAEMVGAMALARAAGEEEQSSAILRASRDQLKRRLGIG
jgi:TetR/AcrR family transcriptional repressor of nem operon